MGHALGRRGETREEAVGGTVRQEGGTQAAVVNGEVEERRVRPRGEAEGVAVGAACDLVGVEGRGWDEDA